MSEPTSHQDPDGPVTPAGINHIVLNVRDIERSHAFWTEILGFRQVATLRRGNGARAMRFYSGDHDGQLAHHDIALVERADLDGPGEPDQPSRLNHVAIAMPSHEAWTAQLAYLQRRGVKLHGRVDRGVSRSVHVTDPDGNEVEILWERPRESWERDIEGALNYARAASLDAVTPEHRLPVFGPAGDHPKNS